MHSPSHKKYTEFKKAHTVMFVLVQIQYKPFGTTKWLTTLGEGPPDWTSSCGEKLTDVPPLVPVLPTPGGGTDGAPASCGMWRAKMWQLDGGSGALKAVGTWVCFFPELHACHCLWFCRGWGCPVRPLCPHSSLLGALRTIALGVGVILDCFLFPLGRSACVTCPMGCFQGNNKRLRHGAADFSTVAPTLTWTSGAPDGTEYKPIRNMPGWRNFKQNFFVVADTLVCVPQSYNIARFMIQIRGRAIVSVDDTKVASMVRYSWPTGFRVKNVLCGLQLGEQ